MKKSERETEKLLDEIEKSARAFGIDPDEHPPHRPLEKLRTLSGVAASRQKLWKRCPNKPCRRKGRCMRETADRFSCEPHCSGQWGEWERGFFAGAVVALGLRRQQ